MLALKPKPKPAPQPEIAAAPQALPTPRTQPAPAAKVAETPVPAIVAETPPVAKPSTPAPVAAAEIPTLTAEPVGAADSGRFSSGKAIIRHGDNLWTIAKRVYGNGIKYTTIFEANDDQIRNPNRIYPGQVFDLPKAGAAAGK